MSDQTFTTESDPKDFTADQVATYLATADEAEKSRVFGLETAEGGKDRKGVKEAATAPAGAPDAPKAEGDGTTPGLDTSKAQTVTEAGGAQPDLSGEAYQKGYHGFVPSRDGDNPVDLTLAGVTGQNKDA